MIPPCPLRYLHASTPGANDYYVVLGVNGAGVKSGNSDRKGSFRFDLVPGALAP